MKVPCSICGGYCSGKLELLIYTKLYPVCIYDWNKHVKTSMKELKRLIEKSSL